MAITWFDIPIGGMSPGGQIEFDTLSVTENGTYSEQGKAYTSVTVNVEGGGGSSDFSTAEVQIIGSTPSVVEVFSGGTFVYIENDELMAGENYIEVGTYTVVLYKGSMVFITQVEPSSTTGAISEFTPVGKSVQATITGDCTMTFDEII